MRERFWIGDRLVYEIRELLPHMWAYRIQGRRWRLTFSEATAESAAKQALNPYRSQP